MISKQSGALGYGLGAMGNKTKGLWLGSPTAQYQRGQQSMRFRRLLISSCLTVLAGAAPGYCDQYCDYGLQLYNQRRFDQAKKYFEQSIKLSPKNERAHFYRAVCCEYLNNADEAMSEYQFVTANSADAKFLAMAKASIDRINKQRADQENKDGDKDTTAKSSNDTSKSAASSAHDKSKIASIKSQGQSTATTASEGDEHREDAEIESFLLGRPSKPDPSDVVPDETRVYFTQSGHDDIYIDAKINGRDLKMILDTGASVTLIGKNQLQELGLRGPTGKATGAVGGIGGSTVPTWSLPVQISLGNLKKKVNVRVADEWTSSPLLGQDFFNNLEYEIDNKAHSIIFRKPKVMSQKDKDQYCVPFRRVGRHLYVTVEVDGGHKTTMIVDTGAEGVAMTMANVKDLALEIPADAQRVRSQGVGGTSDGYGFSIESLRLGPIIQRGVGVTVTTSAGGMLGTDEGRAGLLGQGFFGSWRFTVDNTNGVLKFFH
jgi:predicted aspartyl protease